MFKHWSKALAILIGIEVAAVGLAIVSLDPNENGFVHMFIRSNIIFAKSLIVTACVAAFIYFCLRPIWNYGNREH